MSCDITVLYLLPCAECKRIHPTFLSSSSSSSRSLHPADDGDLGGKDGGEDGSLNQSLNHRKWADLQTLECGPDCNRCCHPTLIWIEESAENGLRVEIGGLELQFGRLCHPRSGMDYSDFFFSLQK